MIQNQGGSKLYGYSLKTFNLHHYQNISFVDINLAFEVLALTFGDSIEVSWGGSNVLDFDYLVYKHNFCIHAHMISCVLISMMHEHMVPVTRKATYHHQQHHNTIFLSHLTYISY